MPRRRFPLWLQVTLLLSIAGMIPLAISGFFSLRSLRQTAGREVEGRQQEAAVRAAELIKRHVLRYREMLQALGGTLEFTTHLTPAQKERILKNHHLDVRDFRAIDYIAPDGNEIATARADGKTMNRADDIAFKTALGGKDYFSKVFIGAEVEPEMIIAVPIITARKVEGVLVARVNLTEMWILVEQLAPEAGTTKIVDEEHRLIAASGDRDKEAVFDMAVEPRNIPQSLADAPPGVMRFHDDTDGDILRASAPIDPELKWRLVLEQPVSVAFAAVRDQEKRLFVTLIAFLVAAAFVGVYGARQVTRPLRALTTRTREIARGELTGRVEPQGAREVAALGDAINQMSQDLVRLQDEIRARERVSSFARFGAGVVHDLGTPIKALQMNAMMAVHAHDDETRNSAIGRLLDEQKVIERQLQLLRSYARGEAIELRPVLVDAQAFVEKAAARAKARWSHVEVSVGSPPEKRTYFFGDPGFLERVVENLCKNAVEAMQGRPTRKLALAITNGADRTVVVISDTGKGMGPDALTRLFEPFRSSKATGLGIGLAMSQWIVNESKGELTCESRVDEGTTFRMALPVKPPECI
jgi:signal transduction histidine kinase